MGAGQTENMRENNSTVASRWHMPERSVTPETEVCVSCYFPTERKKSTRL